MWLELATMAGSAVTGFGGFYLSKYSSVFSKDYKRLNQPYYCEHCKDYFTLGYKAKLYLMDELMEKDHYNVTSCPICGGRGRQFIGKNRTEVLKGRELREILSGLADREKLAAEGHFRDFLTAHSEASLKREQEELLIEKHTAQEKKLVIENTSKNPVLKELNEAIEMVKEMRKDHPRVMAQLNAAEMRVDKILADRSGVNPSLTVRPSRPVTERMPPPPKVNGPRKRVKGSRVPFKPGYLINGLQILDNNSTCGKVIVRMPDKIKDSQLYFGNTDNSFRLDELFYINMPDNAKLDVLLAINDIKDERFRPHLKEVALTGVAMYHGMEEAIQIYGEPHNCIVIGRSADGHGKYAKLFEHGCNDLTGMFKEPEHVVKMIIECLKRVNKHDKRRHNLMVELRYAVNHNSRAYRSSDDVWRSAAILCSENIKDIRELKMLDWSESDSFFHKVNLVEYEHDWDTGYWVGVQANGDLYYGNRVGATLLSCYEKFREMPVEHRNMFTLSKNLANIYLHKETKARSEWLHSILPTPGYKDVTAPPPPPPPPTLSPRRSSW